jgi:molecular chaperone DnaJ/curved DNA-binding protein
MAGKDYYLILGVARSESSAGIRARYRDLVRTLHPDVAGAKSTGSFREVTEAYEVLADPVARRRHNSELDAKERRRPMGPVAAPVAPPRAAPVSLLAEPWVVRPSFDGLVDRLVRNFTGVGVPKAERSESLTVEVILTPDEALEGVEVPLGVPVVHRCVECGGTGRAWLYWCASCGGEGAIATDRVIRIPIPAGVRSGSIIEGPLDGLGIHNLYLRLYVRIE